MGPVQIDVTAIVRQLVKHGKLVIPANSPLDSLLGIPDGLLSINKAALEVTLSSSLQDALPEGRPEQSLDSSTLEPASPTAFSSSVCSIGNFDFSR